MTQNELERRLRWFDRGSVAFERAYPALRSELLPAGAPAVYLCPLCITRTSLKAFVRDTVRLNQLTLEHVPLQKLGGRPLVLTCVECNNTAGTRLDAHAHKADRFVSGEFTNRPVEVKIGTVTVNMMMSMNKKDIVLNGLHGHNADAAQQALTDHFEQQITNNNKDWSLTLNFRRDRHDPESARVSWLRAAYLVAFAKFGYRFALGEALHAVREKIRDPRLDAIRTFKIVATAAESRTRNLVAVTEPQELKGSLAVQMGRHIVLLPRPDDLTLYSRLRAHRVAGNKRLMFDGTPLDWPRGPEHAWDLMATDG